MEDKIWYLKQINILKSLSEKDLMGLGAQCSMMKYKKGELIYFQEAASNVYFIKSGSVKVINPSEHGEARLNDVIEAGEIFGRLTDSGVEGEKVVALEDTLVCYLPYEQWLSFIRDHTVFGLRFIKWVGLRIRRMERKMDSLYFKTSRQRIDEQLHDMINRFGSADREGNPVVNLQLTHDEIAQLTGTSRQNVSTYLNELRADGCIDYDRKALIFKPRYFERTK